MEKCQTQQKILPYMQQKIDAESYCNVHTQLAVGCKRFSASFLGYSLEWPEGEECTQ